MQDSVKPKKPSIIQMWRMTNAYCKSTITQKQYNQYLDKLKTCSK